jgi:hypothetical protein
MRRTSLLVLAAVAAAGLAGAPAAHATCGPDQGPLCYVDCLNRPPWIDLTDLKGTVAGLVPSCPV